MSKKLRRLERRLKTNFSADGRYVLERFVGSGAQGNCFKLRRVDPRRGQRKNIVVKLFGDPSAGDDGVWADDEVRALQIMRGASHVIQMVQVQGDPLQNRLKGYRWAYMDWLPNGTLADFVLRASASGRPLPNRLLWRLFLCLLRGVIACAWPGELRLGASKLEIPVAGLPDTVAKNYDISDDNLMFGAFEPSPVPEHLLSPPLIMIDLGIVTIEKCETQKKWTACVRNMLNQVVEVLDDLTQTLRGDHYQNSKVDPDIRDILNKYQTLPDKQLPGLQDLHRHVLMAVETRDQNWYRHHLRITDASESDDRIQEIVSKYILNPPEGTSSNFCLGP